MRRLEAWSVHLSTVLVAGTGLVYAWMRYLLPEDPFAVVRHPAQPAVQHLHLLVAPLLVFTTGIIWKQHVWGHWKSGVPSRRRSGLALLLALVPMVVSGYLIQTTVSEGWRTAWITLHLVASGLFLTGYLGHAVVAIRSWARRRALPLGAHQASPP